jgi:hypothetical protein
MPRVCTVCSNPEVTSINSGLVAGKPCREIAALYRVSPDAVERHAANHLPQTLARAKAAEEVARADDLLAEARRLKEITNHMLARAVQANDLRTALAAIREARGNLELIGKLLGQLDTRPTVNVLVSPEWAAVRMTLLNALAAHPAARADVSMALLALEHGESTNGHRR